MKYLSRWYVQEKAKHKRAMLRPMLSIEARAIAYAQWLAERDGVTGFFYAGGTVIWSRAHGEKRIKAVSFGSTNHAVTILIPNWDWQPVMTEEHDYDEGMASRALGGYEQAFVGLLGEVITMTTKAELLAATQWLIARYDEQCDKYPRTREIPLATYISANLSTVIRNRKAKGKAE